MWHARETRNKHRVSRVKFKGIRPPGKPGRRWKCNIKTELLVVE
jgi:hypothetical protein